MKHFLHKLLLIAFVALPLSATAKNENYIIDVEGMHAFVHFKIKHLGYSWLYGGFNNFSGTFNYDEDKPQNTKLQITIDTASIDSNHAERDKHLRNADFLEVNKYPKATFTSTSYKTTEPGKGVMEGTFTLHGVTKNIKIDVEEVGAGDDPWGGYRRGFTGTTKLALKDYNIQKDLGPASQEVEMILAIEGVRQ